MCVRERKAIRKIYGFAMVFVQQILFVFTFFWFVQFNMHNVNLLNLDFRISWESSNERRKKHTHTKSAQTNRQWRRTEKRSQFEERTKKKEETHTEWTHTDASRNKNVNDFLPLLFLISAFHQSFCIWKGKNKENTERCYAHISCGYVCMYEWFRKYKSLYWVCH